MPQHGRHGYARRTFDQLVLAVDEAAHCSGDLVFVDKHEFVDQCPAQVERDRRITSYNVCYTKLLRGSQPGGESHNTGTGRRRPDDDHHVDGEHAALCEIRRRSYNFV